MGLKNRDKIEVARTAAREAFGELFDGTAPGPWSMFTETYSTGSEDDDLVFASFLNTIEEWTGAKEYGNFEAFKQDVKLKKYHSTFALDRFDVDYDTSGAIGSAIRRAIQNLRANSDDKLVFDALVSNSGAGPTGFDGAALIADSHSLGDSTYDNKTTSALSHSTYDSAVQAMMGYKTAAGEPMNIFPTHLVVGPKLRKAALEIVGADRVVAVDNSGAESGTRIAAATRTNIFEGEVTVVIWNRLTGTQDDYWYLMDLSKGEMPIMLKNERDYELIERSAMDDSPRFELDKFVWSVEADKRVAAGAWPLIYGGIVA